MHVSGKLDRNFRHFISAKEYLQQLKQMEGSISSCIRCIFLAFEDIQSNPSLRAPRYYWQVSLFQPLHFLEIQPARYGHPVNTDFFYGPLGVRVNWSLTVYNSDFFLYLMIHYGLGVVHKCNHHKSPKYREI